jgi:hypothetical protein
LLYEGSRSASSIDPARALRCALTSQHSRRLGLSLREHVDAVVACLAGKPAHDLV